MHTDGIIINSELSILKGRGRRLLNVLTFAEGKHYSSAEETLRWKLSVLEASLGQDLLLASGPRCGCRPGRGSWAVRSLLYFGAVYLCALWSSSPTVSARSLVLHSLEAS